MKIETMIYVYIAICLSLIVFNCVYVFIIKRSVSKLDRDTENFSSKIKEEIRFLDSNFSVRDAHKKFLCRKLKSTAKLTAFDKSMADIYEKDPEKAKKYLYEIYPIFIYLVKAYRKRDTVKSAYFPYIISKYELLKYRESGIISECMFDMLHSHDVYSRENALKAIYSIGRSDYAVEALKIIDKNLSFHHPKLVCDGLFAFSGDKCELADKLWDAFEGYSIEMQVNILNFLRFAGIRNDEKMFEILTDEERNQELRFSAIRYFEKFPSDRAFDVLLEFAENSKERTWEYQAIASSALKSYPNTKTTQILTNNLSNSNWYVRLNSSISCERLGYSYADLIEVFNGHDRYAREILRYQLDKRRSEEEVVTV